MLNRKLMMGLLAAAMMTSLTGCGSNPAAADDTSGDMGSSDPSYTSPTTTTPTTGTSPYTSPTTTVPTTPAATLADMTATVTAKSHDSILLAKFKCTVEVSNPSSVTRTGTLTVTFVHGSADESGSPAQTQTVSIPANGTQDFDFTDNKWHLLSENATVTIVSDPVAGAATTTPAYGATAAPATTY